MTLILPRRGLLRAMLAAPAIVAAPSLMRVSTVGLPSITGAEITAVWYEEIGPFDVPPAMIEKFKRQIMQHAFPLDSPAVWRSRFIPFNPRST